MDLRESVIIQHIMTCECDGCRAVADATTRLEMVKQERELRVGMAGIRLQSQELFVQDIAPDALLEVSADNYSVLTPVDTCMRCGENPAPREWGRPNMFAFRTPPPGSHVRHPQTGEYIQNLCDDCMDGLGA